MLSESGVTDQRPVRVENNYLLNQVLPSSFFASLSHCQTSNNGHELRVSAYSYAIAKSYGLTEDSCERLRSAAVFHDIGKLMISESILEKPSSLNTSEREGIKAHTLFGYELLRGSSGDVLKEAAQIALYHHERFDGKGYPHGLKGHDIPIAARIVAVADVFDALTSKRVYRAALPEHEVLVFMHKASGSHFDPHVLKAFKETLERFPDFSEQLRVMTNSN